MRLYNYLFYFCMGMTLIGCALEAKTKTLSRKDLFIQEVESRLPDCPKVSISLPEAMIVQYLVSVEELQTEVNEICYHSNEKDVEALRKLGLSYPGVLLSEKKEKEEAYLVMLALLGELDRDFHPDIAKILTLRSHLYTKMLLLAPCVLQNQEEPDVGKVAREVFSFFLEQFFVEFKKICSTTNHRLLQKIYQSVASYPTLEAYVGAKIESISRFLEEIDETSPDLSSEQRDLVEKIEEVYNEYLTKTILHIFSACGLESMVSK